MRIVRPNYQFGPSKLLAILRLTFGTKEMARHNHVLQTGRHHKGAQKKEQHLGLSQTFTKNIWPNRGKCLILQTEKQQQITHN
jgi:hypothetical protein